MAKQEALDSCVEAFEQLQQQRDIHHQAEGFYGIACVFASLSKPEEAIKNLEAAIDITRSNSDPSGTKGRPRSSFVNRAMVDEDLDVIRELPAFRSMIYGNDPVLQKPTDAS
jgi:tetratricopeptide (TPR) repeat protein